MNDNPVPSQGFILGDKLYNRGKWVVMVLLPAISTFYFTLGTIWGLAMVEQVVGTIAALTTFLGALLMISTKTYNNSDARYDGEVVVESTETGTMYNLVLNGDPETLKDKDKITFKVNS